MNAFVFCLSLKELKMVYMVLPTPRFIFPTVLQGRLGGEAATGSGSPNEFHG